MIRDLLDDGGDRGIPGWGHKQAGVRWPDVRLDRQDGQDSEDLVAVLGVQLGFGLEFGVELRACEPVGFGLRLCK